MTALTTQGNPSDTLRPVRVTDRRILWAAVLATVAVTIGRLSGQLLERITADAHVRDLAAGLEDPALAELAVRLGVTLAVVISAVFQIIYLFLCATVDEKLLRGLIASTGRREDRKGRRPGIGPAVLVGIAATLPVQLAALGFGLGSPKDSPIAIAWVVVVVTAVSIWACTRPAVGHNRRGRTLRVTILMVIAAISFLL